MAFKLKETAAGIERVAEENIRGLSRQIALSFSTGINFAEKKRKSCNFSPLKV